MSPRTCRCGCGLYVYPEPISGKALGTRLLEAREEARAHADLGLAYEVGYLGATVDITGAQLLGFATGECLKRFIGRLAGIRLCAAGRA